MINSSRMSARTIATCWIPEECWCLDRLIQSLIIQMSSESSRRVVRDEDNEKKRNRQEHSARSRQWETVGSDDEEEGNVDDRLGSRKHRRRSNSGIYDYEKFLFHVHPYQRWMLINANRRFLHWHSIRASQTWNFHVIDEAERMRCFFL